jgi:transcriptional regulator with XRE-family HTH domain
MAIGAALFHTDSDRVRMRNEIREQIVAKLSDKEYRDIFVSEQINTGLAFQLRAMREAKGWTQTELGEKVGMAQSRVSLMEDANYSRYSLNTLKRLASSIDVALIVRFEPFSELVEHFVNLDPSSLNVASFSEDEFRTGVPTSESFAPLNVVLSAQVENPYSTVHAIPFSDAFAGLNTSGATATFSHLLSTVEGTQFHPGSLLMYETGQDQGGIANATPVNILQIQEKKELAA